MRTLTAIYGGAFDPVHNGHLAIAHAAAAVMPASVVMVPTGDPPHRASARAAAEHRVAMLRLALADAPHLSVDTREIERKGPSYSVDTLAGLRSELGADAPLALVVGADSFLGMTSWSRWRTLFSLAHVVVVDRPGSALEALADGDLAELVTMRCTRDLHTLHTTPAGRIWRLAMPLRHESSSSIRSKCAAGRSIASDVPESVARYIRAHDLYRAETV